MGNPELCRMSEESAIQYIRENGIVNSWEGNGVVSDELEECQLKVLWRMFEDMYDLLYDYVYKYV